MCTFRLAPTRRASTALLLVAASALAFACGDPPSAPPSAPSATPGAPLTASPGAPPSAPPPQSYAGPGVVSLATYDGSGEAVHPDGIVTPEGWGLTTSHVVATPYPGGQVHYENPSYYDVLGPFTWLPPANAANPVVAPSLRAYLSDPDMVYDPETRKLWLYYREVTDTNRILVTRSADGTVWDTPVSVVAVPNHLAISPAVVRRGAHDWIMWTVNGGAVGCNGPATTVELRRSTDGLVWSAPEPVQIGSGDESPWHIDVEWIPSRGEYWAVYNGKTPGSCMTRVLRFATSPDGVTWAVRPSPLLRAGAIPAFADVVYRSSIAYDAATNVVTLLYSGASATNGRYTWQVATEQLDVKALMSRTAAAARSMMASDVIAPRPASPELTNETAP